MKANIKKSAIPIDSEISKTMEGAYYSDSYSFSSKQHTRNALQIWLHHAANTPVWINYLMTYRNKIVSMVGLKNLGHLGDLDSNKSFDQYKIGDQVGIFTLHYISDTEVILGDSDKHLNVKVSVYKESRDSEFASVSTVVHVNNVLGKLYMLFVTPMHKLIVPATIRKAESIDA